MNARLPDIWIREGEGEARVSQVCKICAKSFTISYKYKYKSYLEENIGRQNKETTTEIVSAFHHHSDLNQSIMQLDVEENYG